MKQWNMAILGAGNIASAMAAAIGGLEEINAFAVASRDLGKAKAFAEKWGFQNAYGSYEELVSDPDVDLIYVATPHSHHFEHAKLCVLHGKPALVEKAFTANAAQARELLALAEEKGVFVSEAMWTRFLPAVQIVREILQRSEIGEPTHMTAEFSFPLTHIPRLCEPALAGGALLDLGVYPLTFASLFFGDDIVDVKSTCEKYHTGVDGIDEIDLTYRDGKTAHVRCSFVSNNTNEGTIFGTEGSLYVETLNNFTQIVVRDLQGNPVKSYLIPQQINGYEYEALACKRAIEAGELECQEMPHAETLVIMDQMDALRKSWGVVYPFE